jgi:hypothetical protein
MAGDPTTVSPAFKALAKARLREMRATAKAATEALGLPPAAAPAVLATLHGEAAGLADPTVAAIGDAQTDQSTLAIDDVDARIRLYHLVDRFLRAHLNEQVQRFRALWEAVEPVRFGSRPAPAAGWQFAPLSTEDAEPQVQDDVTRDAVVELLDLLAGIAGDPHLAAVDRTTIARFVQAGREWLQTRGA